MRNEIDAALAKATQGDTPEWRTIQIRRALTYIEQSIRAALDQYGFAANDADTWTAVVSQVSSFLTRVWEQGGLLGDSADEGFTVQCGLGSTMTAQDILEGYMIVQVTLQMMRPGEFIELTIRQKLASRG